MIEPAASSDFCPQSVSGLLCLHPAKEGGLSSWASSFAAYNEMTRLYPELAKVGVDVKELLSLEASQGWKELIFAGIKKNEALLFVLASTSHAYICCLIGTRGRANPSAQNSLHPFPAFCY